MTTQGRFTVVTVEGNRLDRCARSTLLREAGYRVLEASSQEEAFRLVERDQDALLLLQEDDAERFRILADGAPALMWMNGPDGCEFVNRAYLDFLGVSDVDVRGFDWAQYVHPDDRKGCVTAYLEAVIDRRLFEATFRFKRHDGHYRWMKSVGTPRFAADGAFLGYVGSTIDLTDLQAPVRDSLPMAATDSHRRGQLHQWFRSLSTLLASATACIAGLVLVGWAFGLTLLTSLSSQFVSMKITTAVGFLCTAGSVLLFNKVGTPDRATALRIASIVLAIPVVLLGFGTLLGYALGWQGDVTHPGWMAQSTAMCFVLVGIALMFAHRHGHISERLSEYSTFLVLFIAGVALIGYLYDKDSLYAVGPYSSMALHTALSFILLGAALLCANPGRGLMETLSSEAPGAVMMRRMLPLMLGMLVINGWIRLVGEHNGWFDQHFGLTLLVGLNVTGFGFILWSVARSLDQTALALRKSEERLVGIVTTAMDAIISVDARQRITLFNRAAEHMFGLSVAEALGQPLDRFIPERDRQSHQAHVAEFGRAGTTARRMGRYGTVSGLRADGREFPLEASISQLEINGEKLYTVILRDITERKQSEAALIASESRLKLFIEYAPAGIAMFDREMRYLAVSRRFMTDYGITDDPIGRSHYELFPELPERWKEVHRRGLAGEVLQADADQFERLDGSVQYVKWEVRPWYIQGEQIGGILIAAEEVTDQVKTERALREKEERLRLAMEAANQGSWEMDIATGHNIWDKRLAHLLNVSPSEADEASRRWSDFIHVDDRARVLDLFATVNAKGEPFEAEFRVIRTDGSVRWFSSRGRLIDRGGRPRMAGIIQDITERKQAEEQLQEAHVLIEALLSAAPVGFCFLNRELRFERVNQRLADMNGFPVEFHIGKHVQDIVPSLAETVHKVTNEILTTGQPVLNQEFTGETPGTSGERRVWNESWYPIRNSDGLIIGFGVVVEDITERKQAEEALRQSEERWQLAVTGTTDGIWDWDIARHTVFLSSRWKELRGYQEDEIGVDEAEWSSRIHPEDYSKVMTTVQSYLNKELPTFHCEYRTRCKDGRYLWIVDRGVSIWDEQGRAIRMIGSETDITERREAEEQLRESEERLRVLTTAMPQLVWACSSAGECIYQGPQWEAVTGQSAVDSLKYGWAEMIHPEDLARTTDEWRAAIAQGKTYQTEYRLHMRDGTYRWYLARAEASHDASGSIMQWIGTSTDIDEAKQTEVALRKAQERLQRWNVELEQAVHLKTAELHQSQDRLRAMATELNLAEQRERKRLATELHDHLQQMLVVGKIAIGQGKKVASGMPACETVLKKVDEILSDALTYSRTLVAELSPPVLREHGLAASLKWLADYLKHKHGLTVTVRVPEGDPIILPENRTVLIFQSVRELLINSAKHAGTGEATVTMNDHDGSLFITVRDDGKGFNLAAAGAPSGRISSTFGLFSIQERMRALGGSLTMNSAPAQGTTATLVLPLAGTDEERVESGEQGSRETRRSSSRPTAHTPLISGATRVVLVDDHAMVRQGLRSVLDAYADIRVVGEAKDGVEALTLVEELRPRVVVMDINMPKMNGIEATKQMKTKWPETTIIGISVNIGNDNAAAMQRAGAATLLTKEAAVEQLYDAIQEVMKRERE